MSGVEYFLCDQCEVTSDSPMVFRLAQLTEDVDGDEDQIIERFDFCTIRCLQAWAMDMAFTFEDVASDEDAV